MASPGERLRVEVSSPGRRGRRRVHGRTALAQRIQPLQELVLWKKKKNWRDAISKIWFFCLCHLSLLLSFATRNCFVKEISLFISSLHFPFSCAERNIRRDFDQTNSCKFKCFACHDFFYAAMKPVGYCMFLPHEELSRRLDKCLQCVHTKKTQNSLTVQ